MPSCNTTKPNYQNNRSLLVQDNGGRRIQRAGDERRVFERLKKEEQAEGENKTTRGIAHQQPVTTPKGRHHNSKTATHPLVSCRGRRGSFVGRLVVGRTNKKKNRWVCGTTSVCGVFVCVREGGVVSSIRPECASDRMAKSIVFIRGRPIPRFRGR